MKKCIYNIIDKNVKKCLHNIIITKMLKIVDGAMHFVYSHKYTTISAEDSSDMKRVLFIA